jgi:hypothetical protein
VQANALTLYDRGISGAGILAAIIDSGIAPASAEFAGRISAESQDLAGSRGLKDEGNHGTPVAAMLAAARDDTDVQGIAYGATLLVLRTDTPGSCATEGGCSHDDQTIARAIDIAVHNHARVINISLGSDNSGSSAFHAAVARAAAAGVVVVMAAGNNPNADPEKFAQIADDPAVKGLVVVAGASNQNGDIADFSARAGVASAHYLLALGERVQAFDQDGTPYLYSGTSFATPQIAGAVALLAQAFPNLTGRQIVELLFATAVDLGAGGVDPVYGNGRLDLSRAFQPQGSTTVAGTSVAITAVNNGILSAAMGDAGRSASMAGTVMLDGYGRAYGLDIGRTLLRAGPQSQLLSALAGGLRSVAGSVPGTMFAVTIAARRDGVSVERPALGGIEAQAARATAGMVATRIGRGPTIGLGLAHGAAAIARIVSGQDASPFLVAGEAREGHGFRQRTGSSMVVRQTFGSVGLTLTGEQGNALVAERIGTRIHDDRHDYVMMGATVDRRSGALMLSAGLSRLIEQGTVLGGRFSPALGGGGATSDFIDLSARAGSGEGWTLAAAWRQGWTRGQRGGVALTGARLRSTAWSLEIGKKDLLATGVRAALRVAQPLRVARGGIDLTLPVEYDYGAGVTRTAVQRLGLAPDGRELDVEGSMGRPLFGGWASTNLYWRRDPGNWADMPADIGGAVRYTVAL